MNSANIKSAQFLLHACRALHIAETTMKSPVNVIKPSLLDIIVLAIFLQNESVSALSSD